MEVMTNLSTLRGCLVASMGHLEDLLHAVLETTFLGNDEATRYVVAPLLEQQGPLDNALTKARLLVALGRVEADVFADLERLDKLRDRAIHSPDELAFSSPATLQALAQLAHFDARLVAQFEQRLASQPEDPALRPQYLATVENGIRSALALAVVTIEQKIQRSLCAAAF